MIGLGFNNTISSVLVRRIRIVECQILMLVLPSGQGGWGIVLRFRIGQRFDPPSVS